VVDFSGRLGGKLRGDLGPPADRAGTELLPADETVVGHRVESVPNALGCHLDTEPLETGGDFAGGKNGVVLVIEDLEDLLVGHRFVEPAGVVTPLLARSVASAAHTRSNVGTRIAVLHEQIG